MLLLCSLFTLFPFTAFHKIIITNDKPQLYRPHIRTLPTCILVIFYSNFFGLPTNHSEFGHIMANKKNTINKSTKPKGGRALAYARIDKTKK